ASISGKNRKLTPNALRSAREVLDDGHECWEEAVGGAKRRCVSRRFEGRKIRKSTSDAPRSAPVPLTDSRDNHRGLCTFLAAFVDGKFANRRRMRRDPRKKSSLIVATVWEGRGGAKRRRRARLLDYPPTPSSTSSTMSTYCNRTLLALYPSCKLDETFSSRTRPITTLIYRVATLIALKDDLTISDLRHLRSHGFLSGEQGILLPPLVGSLLPLLAVAAAPVLHLRGTSPSQHFFVTLFEPPPAAHPSSSLPPPPATPSILVSNNRKFVLKPPRDAHARLTTVDVKQDQTSKRSIKSYLRMSDSLSF
ncbi:hypothetical protein FB107DRAFT_252027, partial [Schizophyllum commune]